MYALKVIRFYAFLLAVSLRLGVALVGPRLKRLGGALAGGGMRASVWLRTRVAVRLVAGRPAAAWSLRGPRLISRKP